MPKKRFQPEEIIGKLRHADVLLGLGMSCACGRAPFPGSPPSKGHRIPLGTPSNPET